MALKVALQMDPIGPINIDADSTFRIALEAQARGHELFYYTPDKLAFQNGRVTARGWPLTVRREKGNHYTLGAETEVDLADWDVVWLRQDLRLADQPAFAAAAAAGAVIPVYVLDDETLTHRVVVAVSVGLLDVVGAASASSVDDEDDPHEQLVRSAAVARTAAAR